MINYGGKLTDANIDRAVRFMTQCIEGLQHEQAIVNLATKEYRGMPLSNSILLGVLALDDEFKYRGLDFSFEGLESKPGIRHATWNRKIDAWERFREVNDVALMEQHGYLENIAKWSKGQALVVPAGASLKYSPFSSIQEVQEAGERESSLRFEGESDVAKDFILDLLSGEPAYASIFSEIFGREVGKRRNYLFENFPREISKIVGTG